MDNSVSYLIVLRLLHIVCGVFWAGSVIYVAAFVTPAVKALGPEGGKFMQQLAKTNKLPMVLTLTATINVLAGILMLWTLSGGFQYDWMTTTHGLVLSTGALLALIAYLVGILVTRPMILKMGKLGAQIAAGGPPTPEQLQKINGYRQKVFTANNTVAVLLGLTVIAMSLIRYL